jgi:hypothetical protein
LANSIANSFPMPAEAPVMSAIIYTYEDSDVKCVFTSAYFI